MHQVLANTMLRVQLTTQYEGDDPIKDMTSAAVYVAYQYRKGDQVLILSSWHMDPKLNLHTGPYKVISYNKENGTLPIQ
jgi:hypothetical protein